MEGSRHERAATVSVSYVIGFVTALILFANFTTSLPSNDDFVSSARSNTASVYESANPTRATETNVTGVNLDENNLVKYHNGQLMVNNNGEENSLSFNVKTSGLSTDITTSVQGYHYGELIYKTSENGNFVFFCERHKEDSQSCYGFIYDIKANLIYPVSKNGLLVTISDSSAKNAFWSNSLLNIGENYSVNPTKPWVLVDENTQLDLQ
jgi:hypothetical protein